MADLSDYWRKHQVILTSGAEQARSEAMRRMKELSDEAEANGQDGPEAVQGIIDHFKDDQRLGISMLGQLAEVGFIHCLLAEME
jgi:hypothetical protein